LSYVLVASVGGSYVAWAVFGHPHHPLVVGISGAVMIVVGAAGWHWVVLAKLRRDADGR
jgi:hypothetical protein